MSEFLAELVGTAILTLFGGGVCANVNLKGTLGKGADWIVISLGWGLAVMLGVYAVGNVSGAHLNPAVTLGFAIDGSFPWSKVIPFIIAQMIGAMIGAGFVWASYLPHWKKTEDRGAKLGVFSTGPSYPNYIANFLSEIIGTMILVMGLLFIGANKFTDGLNPVIVGLLIVAIGLSLGGATGYAINPARDIGPRIMHMLLPIPGKGDSNWKYSPVPILGPIAGGMFGAALYNILFNGIVNGFIIFSIIFTVVVVLFGIVLNKAILKDETSEIL